MTKDPHALSGFVAFSLVHPYPHKRFEYGRSLLKRPWTRGKFSGWRLFLKTVKTKQIKINKHALLANARKPTSQPYPKPYPNPNTNLNIWKLYLGIEYLETIIIRQRVALEPPDNALLIIFTLAVVLGGFICVNKRF